MNAEDPRPDRESDHGPGSGGDPLPPPETGTDDPRRSARWVVGVVKVMSRVNTWLYQRTGGRLGGNWRVGSALRAPVPVCLLTTTGRRSGEPRTVPLLHLPEGDRVLLVASQGGLPTHPQWYRNVLADPRVTVQVGRRKRTMTAREATPAERAELWPRLVERYADFESYQANTSRVIPVVICEPA